MNLTIDDYFDGMRTRLEHASDAEAIFLRDQIEQFRESNRRIMQAMYNAAAAKLEAPYVLFPQDAGGTVDPYVLAVRWLASSAGQKKIIDTIFYQGDNPTMEIESVVQDVEPLPSEIVQFRWDLLHKVIGNVPDIHILSWYAQMS